MVFPSLQLPQRPVKLEQLLGPLLLIFETESDIGRQEVFAPTHENNLLAKHLNTFLDELCVSDFQLACSKAPE